MNAILPSWQYLLHNINMTAFKPQTKAQNAIAAVWADTRGAFQLFDKHSTKWL